MSHQNSKTDSTSTQEVLEQGDIYFLYRPKVERELVSGLDDVQHLHVILSPHGKQSCRLITIGQKTMPSLATNGDKGWAFIERVLSAPKELERGLRSETHETKTRGTRYQPAARPVAEGVYDLVRHEDEMRLIYGIELPEELGVVQHQLNIEAGGIYILSVKNPEIFSPPNVGLRKGQQADYPEPLQEAFGERKFISPQSADFLDYEGTELILIRTQASPAQEPGLHQSPQSETEETAEIFNRLRMRKSRHPVEALLTGEWV
jgi:hypothetical protein